MEFHPDQLRGKTALVTGSTSGVGKWIAAGLARMGARVGIAARDEAKGRAVVDEIRGRVPGAQVEALACDFGSQASIRALAAEVDRRFEKLHVLVNNAGAINQARKTSADGLELTFAVNHLGYFLLTNLLLPKLEASAPARIISTASAAHRMGKLRWDDLQAEKGYGAMRVYGTSKLANILFTRELAKRLAGTNVTANCFHPGVVASGFGRNDPGLFSLGTRLAAAFMRTPEKAAETALWLAASPEVANVSGRYFANSREAGTSSAARSDADAARLWDVSARLVGLAA